MKKIVGISMIVILGMLVIGCEDRTDVKMKYTKPEKVSSIKLDIGK